MISSTKNAVLSGNTVTFTWTSDNNASGYWVDVSAVGPGGNDPDSSGNLGTRQDGDDLQSAGERRHDLRDAVFAGRRAVVEQPLHLRFRAVRKAARKLVQQTSSTEELNKAAFQRAQSLTDPCLFFFL